MEISSQNLMYNQLNYILMGKRSLYQLKSANIMRYAIKNGGAEQVVNYNLPLNTWQTLPLPILAVPASN